MAGKALHPDIDIKKEIGSGGFGHVYHCSYKNYKDAAVKIIDVARNSEIEKEIDMLKRLKHQYIIELYDVLITPKQVFIITEYIQYGNLNKYIENSKHVNKARYWTKIRRILASVASGLVYMHGEKIVHGDLKSYNVLVSKKDDGILCDFGLSITNTNTKTVITDGVRGTIYWFAPELCFTPPQRPSFESDVWAFGCIILEACTRKIPWVEKYPQFFSLMKSLSDEKDAHIFQEICQAQEVSHKMRNLMSACCKWKKRERPTMSNVRDTLDEFQNSDFNINDSDEPQAPIVPPKQDPPKPKKILTSSSSKNKDEDDDDDNDDGDNISSQKSNKTRKKYATSKGASQSMDVNTGQRDGRSLSLSSCSDFNSLAVSLLERANRNPFDETDNSNGTGIRQISTQRPPRADGSLHEQVSRQNDGRRKQDEFANRRGRK